MTNEEIVAISLCTYMIPKRYLIRPDRLYDAHMPELIPATFIRYIRDADIAELYTFGAIITLDGIFRDGFCQIARVSAGELGQYQVGSNNKHKRLETYIQRRQR